VLLSQDEARFPLVPTLRATLGVKGFRPVVGTWDNKDLVYCFAALNLISGQLTTRLVESPPRATVKTGKSKTRRLRGKRSPHTCATSPGLTRPSSIGRSSSSSTRPLGTGVPLSPRPCVPIRTFGSIRCRATVLISIPSSGCGGCCDAEPPTTASLRPGRSFGRRYARACATTRP
jgi:hypothetical protein